MVIVLKIIWIYKMIINKYYVNIKKGENLNIIEFENLLGMF